MRPAKRTDSIDIPRLETERLLLREFRESDLDAFVRLMGHPDVYRFMGNRQAPTRVQVWRDMARFVGHWQLRGYGLWAVEARASGEFIGRIGLWYPEGWPDLEVGWMLAREYWGQGLATEGGRAALDYAFEVLGADHVVSLIDPANSASIRVAEKLGETFERKLGGPDHPILKDVINVYGVSRPAAAV